MKKVKVVLAVLGSILVLVLVLGVVAATYLKNTFLDFEKDYSELATVQELQQYGHRFLDLNANGTLDVYEDERMPLFPSEYALGIFLVMYPRRSKFLNPTPMFLRFLCTEKKITPFIKKIATWI